MESTYYYITTKTTKKIIHIQTNKTHNCHNCKSNTLLVILRNINEWGTAVIKKITRELIIIIIVEFVYWETDMPSEID